MSDAKTVATQPNVTSLLELARELASAAQAQAAVDRARLAELMPQRA